jgi:thymidylate kinase
VLTTAPNALQLAHAFFRFLGSEGVPYAVVGDVREYGEHIASDVDIVVAPDALGSIPARVNRFVRAYGARLVQAIPHERTANSYVVTWRSEAGERCFLQIDICSDFIHHGRLLMRAHEILAGRAPANEPGACFQLPAPAPAFIYYLLKKIDKDALDDRQGGYLASQWRADPPGVRRAIQRLWPPAHAALLESACRSGDWSAARAALPALRAELRKRRRYTPTARLAELAHTVQRMREPTGLTIALLGADGVGKSTVMESMAQGLGPLFPRSRRIHLRPRLARGDANAAPVVEPHAKPPRSRAASVAKLGWWWTEYAVGYARDVFPTLARSGLVIFDRYFHDILVDPARYRYGASTRLARLVGALVPRPELFIILTAPASVVHERKQEVPLAETERQQEAYAALAMRLPSAHVVDAARPREVVADDVLQIALDHMNERTLRRLKLEG